MCSKPFGDIYYSCLRSYFPGIVISAIYCHSQSHISTIYSLYQRPAFERTCSPFLSWGRIHMYTAAMFTFWSFLWAAFPCRWWLLLGYYCYLLGSSPIAAICHRKHTDLPGLYGKKFSSLSYNHTLSKFVFTFNMLLLSAIKNVIEI